MKPDEVSVLIHAAAFCLVALVTAVLEARNGRR